jgi:hypothetical protein
MQQTLDALLSWNVTGVTVSQMARLERRIANLRLSLGIPNPDTIICAEMANVEEPGNPPTGNVHTLSNETTEQWDSDQHLIMALALSRFLTIYDTVAVLARACVSCKVRWKLNPVSF